MGRKKGKQHGEFSSKSLQAAFLSQIHSHVHDTRLELSRNKYRHNQIAEKNMNSTSSSYKSRINVSVLRGLLIERMIDDRSRDSMFRRATSRILVSRPSESEASHPDSNDTDVICPAGWLMCFNYREARVGIPAIEMKDRIPSLQNLCLKSLAPYLEAYVMAFGKEYIRDRLSELPSELLTKLSAQTLKVNDDLAFVLGCHSHLSGLVLNTKRRNIQQEEDNSYDNDRLGILGLKHLVRDFADESVLGDTPVLTDWENFNENDDDSCDKIDFNYPSKLERLELHNFHTSSPISFVRILQLMRCLSHVSFSNCFNSTTGEQLLLGDKQTETLILTDYIPKVKVLDFTKCSWLTFDLLKKFIKKIKFCNRYSSLEVICVQNCCESISDYRLSCLNMQTQSRPHVTKNPFDILKT